MSTNRNWVNHRVNSNGIGLTDEYLHGVEVFVAFACERVMDSKGKIRCPCKNCKNLRWKLPDDVRLDLYKYGMLESYKVWYLHGESHEVQEEAGTSSRKDVMNDEEVYDALLMLRDVGGGNFENTDDVRMEQEPNDDASSFYRMVEDAAVPIYPNNTKFTKLSFVTKLLHFKNAHSCSQSGFDELLGLIGDVLPDGHTLPKNYYEVKKMVKGLNLGYEKIDACKNDCMLFYKEDSYKVKCDICDESRYSPKTGKTEKNIPNKILRYFPLTPRLQRLYMSSHTAEHMRWYSNRGRKRGQLTHPADGDEWKQFDKTYPGFADEVRNVRLGLATDGFNPFSNAYAKNYSVWPVIMVVYNLPPSMCMKDPYMFMSLLIPGEKSPTKDINIYLRPLIEELKFLWHVGIETFDRSLMSNFVMKAALLWTINDFPAYGMVSGWSTHGRLSCPVCMGDVKGFQLKHSRKCSFFGTARLFLENNDPLRKSTKFGTREMRVVNGRASGNWVKRCCEQLQFPVFGKARNNDKVRADGFGTTHNWTHSPIFFELEYWETLTLRHCIDVMHTEKNVFDNIFHTMLDVSEKTKDTSRARADLQELGIRRDLWMNSDGTMPRAPYALRRDQVRQLCVWVSNLKLPDGYASNIARCSKTEQLKFQGMKSHDCHVFMQKLLPIVARDLLHSSISEVIIEVSNFFQDLCSTTLIYKDLEKMEKDIVRTLCKLEVIFPPSFFDSMEHLPLHLPFECKLGGPVQFRWMYPFERLMRRMKMKVKNKARVEGSIAERYVEEELVNFCSLYFDANIDTVHNRLRRNEAATERNDANLLEAYTYPTRPLGRERIRHLHDNELEFIAEYILLNMPEVAPYLAEFEDEVYESHPNMDESTCEVLVKTNFKQWFKEKVKRDRQTYSRFKELIRGPMNLASSFEGCICNGYRFNCGDLNELTSPNSGVLVKGTCYKEGLGNYYGRLQEVLRINYHNGHQVMIFRCHWFDSTKHVKVDRNRMITVDVTSQLNADDVFVLASQATQVYYASNINNPNSKWYTVVTTKSRPLDESTMLANDDAFQEDVSNANATTSTQIDATIFHEPLNLFVDLSNFQDDDNVMIDVEDSEEDECSDDDSDEEMD